MSREILATFRASPWSGPQEVTAFMNQVGPPTPQLLVGMLEVLNDRRLAMEGAKHGLRCAIFQRLAAGCPDRSLFMPYLKAMRAGDLRVRQLMAELLPKVNNPAAHGELLATLGSVDQPVRELALVVLKQLGSADMMGDLASMAGRVQYMGRLQAVSLAREIAGARGWPVYASVLKVGNDEERMAALDAIRKTKWGDRDLPVLRKTMESLLRDESDRVASVAVDVLSTLVSNEDEFIELLAPVIGRAKTPFVNAAVRAMRRFPTETAMRWLQEHFRMGPNAVRMVVIDTLEAIGSKDVITVLSEALDHKQLQVRMRAAEALQRLSAGGKIDVARTVIWLLRSRDVGIRRLAADVAQNVQDPDGTFWPTLLGFLRDEDWWVRERVTDALVGIAGTQLTRYAVSLLLDDSPVVRRYAVDLLVRLQDPASLGALVRQAQTDDDWWVRERAVEAMGLLQDPRAVPYIAHLMQQDEELTIVGLMAMQEIGGDGAFPYVSPFLGHPDPEIVLTALECLQDSTVQDLLQHVEPLKHHPDTRISKLAGEILIKWQVMSEAQLLQAALKEEGSTLDKILMMALETGADDIMIVPNRPPWIKRYGEMQVLLEQTFTAEQVIGLILPVLTAEQRKQIENRRDLDFSYSIEGRELRFRANVFHQQNGIGAVFRKISNNIPTLEKLGLPEIVHSFGDFRYGLVLVGGPTGSGKSTTLAALIDYINRNYPKHIITIEDPIEVIHKPHRALINQREVGTHTLSFKNALKSTLREDPDVILVGEMRDEETIHFAVSAAETGHLVFGTVHTVSAEATIDRLLNVFPPGQQPQVRSILANCLKAICCQFLVPRKDGEGRVPTLEILLNNDAIANLIRKGKTFQIPSVMATSRDMGMQTMDSELLRLFREGLISAEDAYLRAANKKDFEALLAELEEIAEHRATQDMGQH